MADEGSADSTPLQRDSELEAKEGVVAEVEGLRLHLSNCGTGYKGVEKQGSRFKVRSSVRHKFRDGQRGGRQSVQ